MLKCQSCGRYTLKSSCPECGLAAGSPHPAKFSPADSYGKYRRIMKRSAAESGKSKQSESEVEMK